MATDSATKGKDVSSPRVSFFMLWPSGCLGLVGLFF